MKPTPLWRTFSIFISSTFADMQAERDHLKNIVFPKVEEELQKRRIKLEIVDLRWGVDTTSMELEDEREASVLKVCLDEIKRCSPFFIGLLGDRYGWVPPLERMKTALVAEKHIVPEKGKSVTDLEIEFGVLASREQLVRSAFYFREALPYATFSKKKATMFSDEYNNELSEAEKKERKTSLDKLKANIRSHYEKKALKNKVKTYSGTWDGANEKLIGLETWGDTVYNDILAECESHAKETWDQVPKNWQEQELALLDAFIEYNTSTFCGRKPLLESLKQHLLSENSANWGVVLTGESGSGKSAVFSMVTKTMQHENCFILAHSAGISPKAKGVADLLQIWNKLLAVHLGIKEELKDDTKSTDDLSARLTSEQGKASVTPIEKLQEKFQELLQLVSAKKRVLLLIDALDRFEPTARAQHLSWLPGLMPQNVRLLCTAITGTEQKATKYHKGLKAKSIDIFTTAEAKEMLDALCQRQHKSLPGKIEKIILEKKRADGQSATSSPLWLSLAVNILMAIDQDDFEKMSRMEGRGDQQIETYIANLAQGFDPLPGKLFLSLIDRAGLLFDPDFTHAVFDYIAISRNGLRERDLEKLLPQNTWDPLQFAMLRRWFKAHLVMQGEELQWNLAHSILDNKLLEELKEAGRKQKHQAVGSYLLSLPDNDALKISETMYHLMHVGDKKTAILYYTSELEEEAVYRATIVLADMIILNETGLKTVASLPRLVIEKFENFHILLKRYIYDLNDALAVEGNHNYRSVLLTRLIEITHNNLDYYLSDKDFGYTIMISYFKLGNIFRVLGKFDQALESFKMALNLNKLLSKTMPKNEKIKNVLATSYGSIGFVYLKVGKLDEGLVNIKKAHNLFKKLCETYPKKENYKNGLAVVYEKLGEIYQELRKFDKALKFFNLCERLSKELCQVNPENENLKNRLAVANLLLGGIYRKLGKFEKAEEFFNLGLRISTKLYQTNPKNEILKQTLANSHGLIGDFYFKNNKIDKGLANTEKATDLFKELYEVNIKNEQLKYGLAISYSKLGGIHQAMGHMEEALNCFEKDLKLRKNSMKPIPGILVCWKDWVFRITNSLCNTRQPETIQPAKSVLPNGKK